MKLEAINRQPVMPHGRDRAGRRGGQGDKVAPCVVKLIAVAHPNGGFMRNIVKKGLGRVEHTTFRTPELACRGRINLGAQRPASQLHPVADSQNGHSQREETRIALRSSCLVNARRAA